MRSKFIYWLYSKVFFLILSLNGLNKQVGAVPSKPLFQAKQSAVISFKRQIKAFSPYLISAVKWIALIGLLYFVFFRKKKRLLFFGHWNPANSVIVYEERDPKKDFVEPNLELSIADLLSQRANKQFEKDSCKFFVSNKLLEPDILEQAEFSFAGTATLKNAIESYADSPIYIYYYILGEKIERIRLKLEIPLEDSDGFNKSGQVSALPTNNLYESIRSNKQFSSKYLKNINSEDDFYLTYFLEVSYNFIDTFYIDKKNYTLLDLFLSLTEDNQLARSVNKPVLTVKLIPRKIRFFQLSKDEQSLKAYHVEKLDMQSTVETTFNGMSVLSLLTDSPLLDGEKVTKEMVLVREQGSTTLSIKSTDAKKTVGEFLLSNLSSNKEAALKDLMKRETLHILIEK